MNKDDYEVGYGKPPKNTRFKTGQSGNPKGRPRKPRDLGSLINHELDTTVQITENGVAKRITLRVAFSKTLVNRAVKGDHRASLLLLKFLQDTPEVADFDVELDDLAALEKYKASIAGGSKE